MPSLKTLLVASASALLLAACGSQDSSAPTSTPNTPIKPGKTDNITSSETILAWCNDGDMVLVPDPDNQDRYLVKIFNQDVIDWFEAQSQQTACGPSTYGGDVCVDKQLPWYVSIAPDPDDPQLRLMIIEDLRDYGNGRYLTSEPGTEVRARDSGYDLTINGMKMPNSHTNIRYQVGHWFFERCLP